jgi:hypothetical protein
MAPLGALQVAEGKPSPVTPVADTAGLMPRHGTVSLYPAKRWEDSLATGNGIMGALLAGDPAHDMLIASHCKLWLPLGSREIVPDVGAVLPEMRRIIGEKGYPAGHALFLEKAKEQGWDGRLVWTDPFHPGFVFKIDQPAEGAVRDYARVQDYSTGEAWSNRSQAGDWLIFRAVFGPKNVPVPFPPRGPVPFSRTSPRKLGQSP